MGHAASVTTVGNSIIGRYFLYNFKGHVTGVAKAGRAVQDAAKGFPSK